MKLLKGVFCCVLILSRADPSRADPASKPASQDSHLIDPGAMGYRCSSLNGQATKTRWVEVGLAMDNALYRQLSGLTKAKAAAADILQQADLLYQKARCGLAQPAVRLRLVQVIVFTDADPWVVPADAAGVVNPHHLRDTFRDWSQVHFKDNDVRHLLTGLNIGSALGVANLSTVCTADAVSLSRPALSPSRPDWVSTQARSVAHEIGHTLGLRHDGWGAPLCRLGCEADYKLFADTSNCDSSDFVMGPGGNLWTDKFSECSQYQLRILTTLGKADRYGSYEGVPRCLLDPPSSCEDDPQAECRLTDPCCDNDCRIVSFFQELICRPKAHNECDVAETCSGAMARCPADTYSLTGETCSDITGGAGRCYAGDCHSYASACAQLDVVLYKYTPCPDKQASQPCGDLWCIKPPTGMCGRFLLPGYLDKYRQVPDGTLCSALGHQCLNGVCRLP